MAVKITQFGIDTIQDNTVTGAKIVQSGIAPEDLPMGVPVQIKNVIYKTLTNFSLQTSDTAYPGMSIDITPKLNNSQFVIMVRSMNETDSPWNIVYNIHRNGQRVNSGNASQSSTNGLGLATQTYAGANDNSSTPEVISFSTLDTSGSTKGVTINYKLVAQSDVVRTSYVNSTWSNDNVDGNEVSQSEMIVIEIKGY